MSLQWGMARQLPTGQGDSRARRLLEGDSRRDRRRARGQSTQGLHQESEGDSLSLKAREYKARCAAQRSLTSLFLFCLFRATPEAYGGSQARGWIGATAMPQPQQCGIRATSVIYTTAHGNAGSLTHWVRPGIEPTSSWILVCFITIEPQWELPNFYLFFLLK